MYYTWKLTRHHLPTRPNSICNLWEWNKTLWHRAFRYFLHKDNWHLAVPLLLHIWRITNNPHPIFLFPLEWDSLGYLITRKIIIQFLEDAELFIDDVLKDNFVFDRHSTSKLLRNLSRPITNISEMEFLVFVMKTNPKQGAFSTTGAKVWNKLSSDQMKTPLYSIYFT